MLTIEVDAEAVLAALVRVGDAAAAHVKAAAKVTADAIDRGATARARRRTGKTAEGIHVEETHDGEGYVVMPTFDSRGPIPIWLEFGTKHAAAYPSMYPAAELERGPHLRRMEEAVQAAVDESGLGD